MAIIRTGAQREYLQMAGGVAAPRPAGAGPAIGAGLVEQGGGAARMLAEGLAGGAGLVQALARDYRERQTERVDAAILKADEEFVRWRDEWQAEHQGADAEHAGEVFAAKHAELARAARADLAGKSDEIFDGLLQKRLAQEGVFALKQGLGYERQQEQRFKDSQWAAQEAEFARYVAENPEDTDGIQLKYDNLRASWLAKNPGLDPGAVFQKLADLADCGRVEALIAQGNLGGAEAALAHGVARDPRLYKGGTIAEDLHNPLNLKKVGAKGSGRSAFEVFETDEDGLRAAASQIRLYHRRGITTPEQIIATWAPASDGNNQEAYRATVAKVSGLNLKEPIDVNNVEQLSRLVKGMATQEGPLGAKYSTAQIAAALRANGGVARRAAISGGIGMSPVQAAHYRERIDALRRKAQAQAFAGADQNWRDYFAACADGQEVEAPYSREQTVAMFGPEKGERFWHRVEAEGQAAVALNALGGMTPAEQLALVASFEPAPDAPGYADARQIHARLQHAVEQDQKERAADPVAYALRREPELAASLGAFLNNPDPQTFNQYLLQRNAALRQRGLLAPGEPAEPALPGGSSEPPAQERSGGLAGAEVPARMAGGTPANLPEGAPAQEQAGGKPANIPFLDKTTAQILAARISAAASPGEELRRLEQAAGRHWPGLAAEMMGKVAPRAQIMANIPDEAARLLNEAGKIPDFQKQAFSQLGLKGPEKTGFEEDLQEQLKPYLATFNAQGALGMAENIRQETTALALQLMLRGEEKDATDAGRRAVEQIVKSQYSLAESPGSGAPFRVPKSYDAGLVEQGAAKFLRGLDVGNLNIRLLGAASPQRQKGKYRQLLNRAASVVVNQDESGVIFYLGTEPLRDRDENIIQVGFRELEQLAREKAAPDLARTAKIQALRQQLLHAE